MKEKTLEDFKKSFAQDKGFEDWERFCFSLIQGTHSNMGSITIVEVYLDIISENYANHVKAIALQEGRNEGFLIGAKYGYEYHQNSQFPEKNFEDNAKGNVLQIIESNVIDKIPQNN